MYTPNKRNAQIGSRAYGRDKNEWLAARITQPHHRREHNREVCILEQRLILTLAREQNGDLAARAAYTATSRAHVFLGVLDGRTGALIWAAFFLLSLSLSLPLPFECASADFFCTPLMVKQRKNAPKDAAEEVRGIWQVFGVFRPCVDARQKRIGSAVKRCVKARASFQGLFIVFIPLTLPNHKKTEPQERSHFVSWKLMYSHFFGRGFPIPCFVALFLVPSHAASSFYNAKIKSQ